MFYLYYPGKVRTTFLSINLLGNGQRYYDATALVLDTQSKFVLKHQLRIFFIEKGRRCH